MSPFALIWTAAPTSAAAVDIYNSPTIQMWRSAFFAKYRRRGSLFGGWSDDDTDCRRVWRETIRKAPRRSVVSLLRHAAMRSLPRRVGAIGCSVAASSLLAASEAHAAATTKDASLTVKTNPLEPAMRAVKFWRRVGPVVVHYKFTEMWFRVADVDPDVRRATWDKLHSMHAPGGLDVILELRGLFVKIGQVMSSRADFVPRQYVDAFHTLQDSVPPWEKGRVEAIVRESLRREQNLAMEDVFENGLGEVLGSASIGQVHGATLTPRFASSPGYSGGRTVAVKVMHPDAEFRFRNDFKIFRALCKVALPGWDPILRELEQQMMTEFDYKNEAHNLACVRANMAKSPYSNKVRVPQPIPHLCSENLLVMEYLSGKKLAVAIEERLASILGGDVSLARKVLRVKQQQLFETRDVSGKGKTKNLFNEFSNLVGEGTDMSRLQKGRKARQVLAMTKDARKKLSLLLDASGHQIFQDGVFNGDAHPGNVLELDCGRLGLIDYGQTRRLSRDDRLALAAVVSKLGKSSSTPKEIADAMRNFGFRSRDDNDDIIAKNAALYFDSDAAGKAMGCATPQTYLQHLNSIDPMIEVPDPAVFVARTSFLFRGLGALLQQQLHTARRWRKHANIALEMDGERVSHTLHSGDQ